MIEAITGECVGKTPGSVLLKTAGGLSYRVWVPVSYYAQFTAGQQHALFTHYKLKEDEAVLYGFFTEKELALFRKLLTVSGVGGKTALAVLSAYSVEEVADIFMRRDDTRISAIPGIGKKTAQRMILELSGGMMPFTVTEENQGSPMNADLVSALINLGFLEKKAREAVSRMQKSTSADERFEDLFKRALKEVSRV
jgi:Holliday junction DNA helicase RuvA